MGSVVKAVNISGGKAKISAMVADKAASVKNPAKKGIRRKKKEEKRQNIEENIMKIRRINGVVSPEKSAASSSMAKVAEENSRKIGINRRNRDQADGGV